MAWLRLVYFFENKAYVLDMITSALISLLGWIILGVAFVLPTGTFLPTNFADTITDVIEYAYGWDWLVPMSTVFSVFSAIVIFFVAELGWNSGKFLVRLMRGN